MQAGVRELGEQVPGGAGALRALAAECVRSHGDGLHADLGAWLSSGVVHVRVAAGGGWGAVAGVIVSLCVGLGFNLNHSADTGAERGGITLQWDTETSKQCLHFCQ